MTQQSDEPVKTHTVRPRWTWLALVVMVAGLVLIGIGISVLSWTWAIAGIVVLGLGAAAALYGGFFYDVQGGGPGAQAQDVVEGRTHEFPDATTRRTEDEVKEDVHRRWLDDE
jgi:hypothetical protein